MLTHKQKVKLARKLMTRQELKDRKPLFQTKAWEARKQSIANKVKRRGGDYYGGS